MQIRSMFRLSRVLALVVALCAVAPLFAADAAQPPANIPLADPITPPDRVAPNADLKAVFDSLPAADYNPTRIRLLWNNEDSWFARWQMIEGAKQTIDCTYYIIDKDIFGQAFLGLLRKKAKEGVKVRLMVDGRIFRSGYMKGMPDRMQELAGCPNVEVKLYNPVSHSFLEAFDDLRNLFASNHQKILLADGKLGMTGGRNIGPDYFGARGEGKCIYRDTDVVMEGEYVCRALKAAFEFEYNSLHAKYLHPDMINFKDQSSRLDLAYCVMHRYMLGSGLFSAKEVRPELAKILEELNADIQNFKKIVSYDGWQMFRGERQLPVKIVSKDSHLGVSNEITPTLLKLFDAAQNEIVIQNPYLVISEGAEEALKRASARGVTIVLHSNSGGSTDSLFPQAFLMNDYVRMLKEMPTCHLYVAPTENERLHSKTFVIDQQLTIVGSYNMDPLSQDVNAELVSVTYSPEFGKMTRLRIQKDMGKVVEYTIKTDDKGVAKPDCGPEDHLGSKIVKKMNLLRKLQWLRPVI